VTGGGRLRLLFSRYSGYLLFISIKLQILTPEELRARGGTA
jgi:hypothetical protein